MAQGQGKRVRDYSAERARRNAEARRWGFTSLDQMSKARRQGLFPSRRVLLSDPSAGMRAKQALEDREMQTFERSRKATPASKGGDVSRTASNARLHDRESQEWSDLHSQQRSTRFNRRWSAAKKERYYQTFVRPWGETRTPEQREAYYEWQLEYEPEFTETDNPYV